ncbi:MAG TPA: FAD-dependent oxidoreductase [Aliidiomarina sp.]|nr:FAD-dependent oxidoreductase [Aliidiomarina sp.]
MASIKTSALVVGGGMVGAALAIGLARQGKQVTVVDPQFVRHWQADSDYDLRISAVTNDNIQLLDELDVWQHIRQLRVFPFTELAVSDTPRHWLELGDPNGAQPLGYMIENKVLQHALFLVMEQQKNIHLLESPLAQLSVTEKLATTDAGDIISFDMVFGCDGGQSRVRAASGISVAGRDYGQRCLLSIVATTEQVPMRTWELFQGDEIHALLPLANNFACCIVYGNAREVSQWQQSHEQVAEVLKTRFAQHIGDFNLQRFASFPLIRQSALRYVQTPTVLLGDAAHTIHPMAGQGVNLGFRDVKALLKAVAQHELNDESGLVQAFKHYERSRRLDNELMAHAMDAIGWSFQQEMKPIRALRGLMLTGLQRFAPGRSAMTAYASGVWKL